MNTKLVAVIIVVIVVIAGAGGYIAYSQSTHPTATPTPSPTAIITPSPTPTHSTSPTASPTAIPSTSPTASPTAVPTATPSPSPTPTPVELHVSVASSMVNVVANMTAAFEKQYNCKLIINSGSSSTLETQIASGTACDVFLSADNKWTKALSTARLVSGGYINNSFTTNKLVVIVAQGNPKNITSLADLASTATGANKIHLVIALVSVPVGSYTNQTLTKITGTWGNSSSPSYITNGSYVNYYTNFQNNVINQLQSDEQVVGAVNLNVGVADAGIVYYSDEAYANLVGQTVSFIPIPDSVNTIGTYGICIPTQVTQSTVAQAFYNYWLSAQGQTLLTQYGFGLA
jgi:ABC-type molybdate transport system substrate-binding protein